MLSQVNMEDVEELSILILLVFLGFIFSVFEMHCHAEEKRIFGLPKQATFGATVFTR